MEQGNSKQMNEAAQILTPQNIAHVVYDAIRQCATTLRSDVYTALDQIYRTACSQGEEESRSSRIIAQMIENANIAEHDGVPLCQDTGTTWICLEVGEELTIPANIFSLVNDAVKQAYTDGLLRMSVVADALFDRTNTASNTPAFCEIKTTPKKGAVLHVLLKGGGSDNASRVVMLSPDAGVEGVMRVVLETVHEKAANACPPLIIGLGVGSTFDKVASLAKHALLREIGSPAQSDEAAAFETGLLNLINDTNIGPGALGGYPTALTVNLISEPCHIAALPVAVNMGCCAMRSASITLIEGDEQ